MTRVFWDTNIFIYLFERNPTFFEPTAALRARMLMRGDVLLTSALVVGEILAGPVISGSTALIRQYEAFFAGPAVTVIPFDMSVARHFANIRAVHDLSSSDAIHLACAVAAEADLFITNDERLHTKIIPGLKFISSLMKAPI